MILLFAHGHTIVFFLSAMSLIMIFVANKFLCSIRFYYCGQEVPCLFGSSFYVDDPVFFMWMNHIRTSLQHICLVGFFL